MKIRPAVLLGEIILGIVSVLGMAWGYEQVSSAAVVGIVALLPKLVETEANGN